MVYLTLTNAEIIKAFPILADYYEKANSGSSTTADIKTLQGLNKVEVEDAFICFLNDGTDRIITDFTDYTFTFDNITVAVDNTTMIAITKRNYISDSERAETKLIQDLKNQGAKIENFLNKEEDLRELHLLGTLKNICFNLRKDTNEDDIYNASYLDFKEQYDSNMARLVADYDLDEDGVLDDGEEDYKVGQIVLGK